LVVNLKGNTVCLSWPWELARWKQNWHHYQQ